MGEKKMVKTSMAYCASCRFMTPISDTKVACDYIGYTGKRRGCPLGYCDKYERDPAKRVRKAYKKLEE